MHIFRGFSNLLYNPLGVTALGWPAGRITGEEFSSAAKGGYQEADLTIRGPARAMMQWYYRLGSRLRIVAPGGSRCWEGMVWRLAFSNGVSYDLSELANAVLVEYSSEAANGLPGVTAWTTDAASIARYGRIEVIERDSQLTAAGAVQFRDLVLYLSLHSLATEAFPVPIERQDETIELKLTAYGLNQTLAFERWISFSTGAADTGLQIRAMITASTFVTATTTTVPNTGFSIDQERANQYMPAKQEIERLAAKGDGSANHLWFQVWNDGVGYLVVWGGGVIAYYANEQGLFNGYGVHIPTYLARPDRTVKTNRFLPGGYGTLSDVLDTPSSVYLLETRYVVGSGLEVRPAGWKDFIQLAKG